MSINIPVVTASGAKTTITLADPVITGLPAPWLQADVGAPALAGSASWAANVFTIKGAGADIWATVDQFHFVYQPLPGDGQIIARVVSETNTDIWAKAGVMIKQSTAAGSPYALIAPTPAQGTAFQANFNQNVLAAANLTPPNAWLKLVRVGSTVTGYSSANGTTWTQVGTATVSGAALIGLFVNSHNASQLCTGTFDNASVTVSPPPPPGTTPTPGLFFSLPNMSSVPGKKVFAHHFGMFPRSIENAPSNADYFATQWIPASGEGNKHIATGGLMRDRPVPRAPRPTATMTSNGFPMETWRYQDGLDDVATAQKAGLDGFFCDLLEVGGNTLPTNPAYRALIAAASDTAPGFFVIPMVDADALKNELVNNVAAAIAEYANKPSTYLVGGVLQVGTFNTQSAPLSFWQNIFTRLQSTYGITAKLISVLTDASYDSVQSACGVWGIWPDPVNVNSWDPGVPAIHSRGKLALMPVWMQDVRVSEEHGRYWVECLNTAGLRAHWDKVIANNPEYVQVCTWSDFTEGSQFCPTPARGQVALDISSYYLTKYKTGSFPTILNDVIYLSYRNHVEGAPVLGGQSVYMVKQNTPSPQRYAVEALVFLTAPATVEITTGGTTSTFSGVAGMNVFTATAKAGTVSSRIVRSGVTIASLTAPHQIRSNLWTEDRAYYQCGSIRGTAGQFDPSTTSTGAIPPYPAVAAVAAGAFFDDFNGPAGSPPNPAFWSPSTQSWTGGIQVYQPGQVFLDGLGNCVIEAKQAGGQFISGAFCGKAGGYPQPGAAVPLSWGYGRLESRIKMPQGFAGSWPAWWFLGAEFDGSSVAPNGWPFCGEMDIMEGFSDSTYYYATSHGPGGPNTGGAYNQSQVPVFASDIGVADFSTDYHVYWCERHVDSMTFGVDNLTKATFTAAQVIPPSVWALNKNVFPIFDFMLYGTPDVSKLPARMLIDWVKFTPAT